MVVVTELERLPPTASALPGAGAGRPVAEPDHPVGSTTAALLDLPALWGNPPSGPRLLTAAAGAEGWRGAALSASYDDGVTWAPLGAAARNAILGHALSVLPTAGPALLDRANSVDVQLLNEAMWLESRDDGALVNGANAAALGNEILQFGNAEPLGGGRFRLSRLLRGRRGSEWAAPEHGLDEPFVLLEPSSLLSLDAPLSAIGATAALLARGVGDGEVVVPTSRLITGEAVRPPSPVHLRAERQPDGALLVTWVRRSRTGWEWMSGSDTPLGEEAEAYRLSFTSAGGGRTVELARPIYRYDADDQEDDGLSPPFSIRVVQLGTLAPSREAVLVLS
jgi:hypothetical protein